MLALVGLVLLMAPDDSIGLDVEDIPAYLAALSDGTHRPAPPTPFLDLWKRPDDFLGKRVTVSGRVAREFSAPASGELPARIEFWLVQDDGNLICAVVPRADGTSLADRHVEICGTSLGLVRYQSGDVTRLAPLIVGPGPVRTSPGRAAASSGSTWDGTSWLLGLIATGFVLILLARAFARRPARRREDVGPGVEFHS